MQGCEEALAARLPCTQAVLALRKRRSLMCAMTDPLNYSKPECKPSPELYRHPGTGTGSYVGGWCEPEPGVNGAFEV